MGLTQLPLEFGSASPRSAPELAPANHAILPDLSDYPELGRIATIFFEDLPIAWQSIINHQSKQIGIDAYIGGLIGAAVDMYIETGMDFSPTGDLVEAADYPPLKSLRVIDRINFQTGNKILLMDGTYHDLRDEEVRLYARLNEFQFRFLQHFTNNCSYTNDFLGLAARLKERDDNPEWLLNTHSRSLLISIYEPSRIKLLRGEIKLPDEEIFQIEALQQIKENGSINHNLYVLAASAHMSKIVHGIIVNADSLDPRLKSAKEAISEYVQPAFDLQDLSSERMTSELEHSAGFYRRLVEETAQYLSTWFIQGNLDYLAGIPFSSEDIDQSDLVLTLLQQKPCNLRDAVLSLTNIDLAKLPEILGLEPFVLGYKQDQLGIHDLEELKLRITEISAGIETALLAHDNIGSTVTVCHYLICLARLFDSKPNFVRGQERQLVPNLAIPNGHGGHDYADAVVIQHKNSSFPSIITINDIQPDAHIELVEIKARKKHTPPSRPLAKDVRQTRRYIKGFESLGLGIELVHFCYVALGGTKTYTLSTAEIEHLISSQADES